MFAQVLQRSRNGCSSLVYPRSKRRIAAMVVSKLVSQNSSKLGHGKAAHEWQTQTHHATAANSHHAATLCDPRVQVGDYIDILGRRLASLRGYTVNQLSEPRVLSQFQPRARRR